MVNNYSLFRKSDCGTVGRAVASNPRGLRLQSRYWHLLQNICSMSVVKKKERRGRDGSLIILFTLSKHPSLVYALLYYTVLAVDNGNNSVHGIFCFGIFISGIWHRSCDWNKRERAHWPLARATFPPSPNDHFYDSEFSYLALIYSRD